MTIETFETIGTLFFAMVGIFMFGIMPKINWYKIFNKKNNKTLDK